jgi:hypothetical protein
VNLSHRSLFIVVSFVVAAAPVLPCCCCCSRCRCRCYMLSCGRVLHGLHVVVVLFEVWVGRGGGVMGREPPTGLGVLKLCALVVLQLLCELGVAVPCRTPLVCI